jgi:hypothetical protein
MYFKADPPAIEAGVDPVVVHFTVTGRGDERIAVPYASGRRLATVRFTDPFHRIVRRAELPKVIRWRGRKILVVKALGDDFARDDYVRGIAVSAELYFEEES